MRISAGLRRGDGIYKEQTCCPKDAQCFPSWHHVKAAIGVCTSTYSTMLGSILTTHPLSKGALITIVGDRCQEQDPCVLAACTHTVGTRCVMAPSDVVYANTRNALARGSGCISHRGLSSPCYCGVTRNTQLRQQVPIPVQPWRALLPSPEQHEKPSKLLSRIQLHGRSEPIAYIRSGATICPLSALSRLRNTEGQTKNRR